MPDGCGSPDEKTGSWGQSCSGAPRWHTGDVPSVSNTALRRIRRSEGAVNILTDLTDSRQADFLELQARKCRRLALAVDDRQTTEILNQLASEYHEKARLLRAN